MKVRSKYFSCGAKLISQDGPSIFIADIAANHDGDLSKAKELIHMAADAGADVAKFQHFTADTIVSDRGFRSIKNNSHQSGWTKPVYEVYKDAELNINWTAELKAACELAGIEFMTSPYSIELVDIVDEYVNAYKIGSGDITYLDIINHIARKNKPVLLATGASDLIDVERAMDAIQLVNKNIVLMQCNTNYTGSRDNFKYANLKVLDTFKNKYPDVILGLSDHNPGFVTVLGAIALGATVIEKHFTDNNDASGPDHAFSLTPKIWREMVNRSRDLESSLGDGIKRVEANELETNILQRRSLRIRNSMVRGAKITAENLIMLRPCPEGALSPMSVEEILGKSVVRELAAGEHLEWKDLSM